MGVINTKEEEVTRGRCSAKLTGGDERPKGRVSCQRQSVLGCPYSQRLCRAADPRNITATNQAPRESGHWAENGRGKEAEGEG